MHRVIPFAAHRVVAGAISCRCKSHGSWEFTQGPHGGYPIRDCLQATLFEESADIATLRAMNMRIVARNAQKLLEVTQDKLHLMRVQIDFCTRCCLSRLATHSFCMLRATLLTFIASRVAAVAASSTSAACNSYCWRLPVRSLRDHSKAYLL